MSSSIVTGLDMRTPGALCLTALLASVRSCDASEATAAISFAEETHRAALLNKVTTTVFAALEAQNDADTGGVTEIAKSTFKSALGTVLRSLKGTVAETCNELAAIAQKRIRDMETGGASTEDEEEFDFDFSFAQASAGKKRHTRVHPHRFLEDDARFFGTVQSLAKKALLGLASSLKHVLKDSLSVLLPQIKAQAVEVFRKACEEAESSVLEAA